MIERVSDRRKSLVRTALLAAATLSVALASGVSALVGVAQTANPSLALRYVPDDAVALVADNDARLLTEGEQRLASGSLAIVARRALRAQAINAGALRQLATNAEYRGQSAAATRLLLLGERVSRRDIGTQLQLLEKQIARDNVPGALVHYDRILRTNAAYQPLLFPKLDDASSDTGVALNVVALLASAPPWLEAFLDWAIYDARAMGNLATLLPAARGKAAAWTEARDAALVRKFVDYGEFRGAFALYARAVGGPASSAVVNGDFARTPRFPPIDWRTADTADLEIELPATETGGARYATSADSSAKPLVQLLALRPGRYALAARMAHNVGDSASVPRWMVTCVGDGGPVVGRLEALPATSEVTRSETFAIPDRDCTHQWLTLEIRATGRTGEQSGTIVWVAIAEQADR